MKSTRLILGTAVCVLIVSGCDDDFENTISEMKQLTEMFSVEQQCASDLGELPEWVEDECGMVIIGGGPLPQLGGPQNTNSIPLSPLEIQTNQSTAYPLPSSSDTAVVSLKNSGSTIASHSFDISISNGIITLADQYTVEAWVNSTTSPYDALELSILLGNVVQTPGVNQFVAESYYGSEYLSTSGTIWTNHCEGTSPNQTLNAPGGC